MTWWYAISLPLCVLVGGGLMFLGLYVGLKVAKEGEIRFRPAPPPAPIYDTPEERNRIVEELQREERERGIHADVLS